MSIQAINVRNQFRGKVKEIIEGPVWWRNTFSSKGKKRIAQRLIA